MGRLSHREIHLHHASEIGLEGVERRPTFGLTLTIAEDVELLLRVGERPDLLLTLGAKVPQVGRDDSNRRIWHQPPNVDGSASGELGRDVNAVRVKERLLIGRAVHDRPTHGEYARQRIRDASARQTYQDRAARRRPRRVAVRLARRWRECAWSRLGSIWRPVVLRQGEETL
jgi:hypothetical protein